MNQKKPFIVPVNQPTCYVSPEIMREVDNDFDEENWINLLTHIEKIHKPGKRFHVRQAPNSNEV